MEIVSVKQIDMSSYGHTSPCNVHCIHVKVRDIEPTAQAMIKEVTDVSWIGKLDAVSQLSFNANSKRTIENLVNDIFSKITDTVTTEFGEYLVSHTAQNALETEHSHIKLPLAELLKYKDSGNPGFDFHTESHLSHVIFGEAKYSADSTPRADALDQIAKFIVFEKDKGEIKMLEPLLTSLAVENFLNEKRGYVAAFSLNAKNVSTIFENALKSSVIKDLITHQELYLIAVEVCK